MEKTPFENRLHPHLQGTEDPPRMRTKMVLEPVFSPVNRLTARKEFIFCLTPSIILIFKYEVRQTTTWLHNTDSGIIYKGFINHYFVLHSEEITQNSQTK